MDDGRRTPGVEQIGRVPVLLRVPASAENLTVARQVATGVARAAGLTGERIEDVQIAVTEACTNAVRHAYHAGEEGMMTVAAWIAGGRLLVSVRDRGGGFTEEDGRPEGVGLLTIRALAQEVSVRTIEGHGTEITMGFDLPASG